MVEEIKEFFQEYIVSVSITITGFLTIALTLYLSSEKLFNYILYTTIIFSSIYFIFGFICYGTKISKKKEKDNEKILRLGLSREALEFKPLSRNSLFKIGFLIFCLAFSGVIFFGMYITEDFECITFDYGFRIW